MNPEVKEFAERFAAIALADGTYLHLKHPEALDAAFSRYMKGQAGSQVVSGCARLHRMDGQIDGSTAFS